MDRNELIKANDELHRRRQALGTAGGLRPISQPVSALIEQNGQTVVDYFQALVAGQETGNERQVVEGCRRRWESFDSDRHPDLVKAIKAIKKWYNQRLALGGALIIAGGFGCGKTHLAQALADLYGWKAVFFEETKLFKSIQESYGGYGESEASLIKRAWRSPLLIFDDLGSYKTDRLDWVQNIYRQLFDRRFEEGKAYLITTNLSLKAGPDGRSEIEQRVGGRNFTRIMGAVEHSEFYVNLFNVPDYRLRNFR